MPKQFLSINEAAAQLGISPKTLRRWEEQGIITPKRTIGNQRRYALSDLTSVGNKTLTIHQAATQLGVSAKTLRRWEEKGLLVPERTSGNQRRYSQQAINKLGMQQYPNAPKRKAKNDPLPTPNFVSLPQSVIARSVEDTTKQSPDPVISRNEKTRDLVEISHSVRNDKSTKEIATPAMPPRNDNVKNETDTPHLIRQFKFPKLPSLPREALAKWGRPNKYVAYGFLSLCLLMISTGLFLYSGSSRAILSQLLTNDQEKQANNQVLQASTKQRDFALRVSVNADFLKNASISGILTAPNITYRVIAGDNITVTGDPQNPVISAVVEDLEAFGLIAGDGIAIDGTTITNTAPGTDQDIFANIKVGSTTISAGSNTDTFELAAGSNISLTTDTGNKKITIAADVPTPDSGIDGIEVLEGGTSLSDAITSLDFLGGDFDVGESPSGEANIQLASTLTSVTGVAGSFTVANDLAVTGNADIDGTFTLGSDTVNDLTGVGLTVSGSTLQVNLTTLGGAGSLSSNSGLEVGANGLTLLKGCSDTQVLKWDDTNTVWQCANDTGGGGVVGGTGAANQIAFWTDPSTISGNNDFYWNNTTERLGIGTNGAPLTTFDLRGNTSHLAAASLSANTSAATLIVDNATGALFTASSSGLTRFTIAQNGDVTSSGSLAIDGSLSNLSGSTLTINDALSVVGNISLTGAISDSDSELLLDDETNIGSLANGINIETTGVISDIDGNVNINDSTDIAGDLDISGSLTSGNSNAFQVDANGNISSTGTTGITLSGAGAGFTFSGTGNHAISASSGTLQLGAATLTGAITGGGQNITNLGQLTVDNLELNGNTLSSTASDLILDSFSGSIQLADLTTNGVVYTSGGNGTLTTEALLNVARGGTGVNGSSASNGQLLIGNGAGFSLANLSAGSGITISNGSGSIQISQTGSGASKWTQLDASGILYPNISTLDLLVGGVSSETAKFAFLNNAGGTPTASIGGTISLTGNGELKTTNNQTLTLGGDSTGNIILSPRNGSGDVRINGTTTLNGLTYSWPGSQGTNYVLQTDGNGSLTWMDPGTLPTANYWVQGNGILYPKIADVFDFLLGGEATTSAEFAITGINNGTPIATLSAIANNTGLSLNASTGTLQSFNYGTLTLGGDTTGNIAISPKNGTGTLALNVGELTINGDTGETSVSPTCVSVTNGIVTGLGGCGAGSGGSVWTLNTTDGTLYPINNTMDLLFGGASTASAKFAFLNIAGNTPTASISAITNANALSLDATGIIGTTNKQTLTLGTASTGDINLVIGGSNELRINGTAGADVLAATCVIASNGIVTGTGSCDSPLSSFIWSTSADGGAIIEGNTTRDLLIGGEATTSAKFAVLNVNSGTPTATLSGQTGGTYLTANGELRTENNQSLTLGGTGTGNIVIDSGNNVIRLADLATNGVVYTSGGNGTLNTETLLDVSRGGTGVNATTVTNGQLLIGNDTNNDFDLTTLTEGTGITITNGAGSITIAQNASGLSKWTQNETDGTLYSNLQTLDLLVGGTSTTSAKFAVLNVAGGTPTASVSGTTGGAYLTASGQLLTTNKQTLTIGDTSTGNILIGSDATARNITIGSSSTTGLSLTDDNWSVTGAGIATFEQLAVNNLQLDGNTLQTNSGNLILDSAGGTTFLSDLTTDGVVFTSNGDGTLSTETTLSVSRGGIGMDATTVTNGQILIGNDTNNDFDLATLTPGAGIQITNAAGSITIAQTETGGSKWTQSDANGVLHPNIETLDLLVGGIATNSAKFAVLNVAGGTPVASVSSGTGGGGTYLTANGTLSTTNKQTLTLGDFTNTGNINVISESNNGRIDNYFGLFSPIGFTINQTVVGERLSISGYGQVGINLLNSTTNPHLAALDLRAPVGLYGGTQPVASISGSTSFAGLVVDNNGSGDIFTASSSGLPRFTIHQNGTVSAPNYAGNNAILYAAPTTGQLTALTTNTSTLCLVSGDSTPSWTSCTGAGSNWDVTNGIIAPKLAANLDLLIGGTTSSSARFHAFSSLNAGTTPAASISANSNSFAGLVVDNRGNGDIFTASRGGQTLFTIGNDRIQLGTGSATGAGGAETPQLLGLDSKGSTGDPVHGRQGDMYYNTADDKFRCYQGTGWRDCIAISQSEYLRAERITAQLSPELDVNDRIYFNVASSSAGSSISLNTSSYGNGGGQITLKAGRTYRLYSDINQRTIFGSNTSALVYGWYNVTSGAYIAGSSGSVVPVDVNFGDSRNQGSPAEAIFTPSVDTTVEVRIRDLNGGSLTSIGFSTLNLYPYSFVEVISGAQELSASEYLRAEDRTDEADDTEIDQDDHIQFDTVQAFSGSSITLDTSTSYVEGGSGTNIGRFTLKPGKTYRLSATVPYANFSSTLGYMTYAWYNITSSSFVGSSGGITPGTYTGAANNFDSYAEAIITPSETTIVELRLQASVSVEDVGASGFLAYPNAFIEVISDLTRIAQFTGATSAADGAIGYVPAPVAGQEGSLLLGNGTWTAATNVKIGTTLTQPIASLSARTSFAGLVVDNQLGDLFAASSSGMSRFVIGQNGSITTNGVAGITSSNPVCVTTTNGIVTGTGACTGGTGGSNWTLDTSFGVIRPNNSTLDLLIGGASSASAKFHVYGTTNDNGIQPVASVSGNTSQAAFIVDNRVGDLFTASSSGLNRFVIKQNGQIGIGTAVPSANRDVEIASSNTFAYTKFNPTTNEDWTIGAEALGFAFYNDTDGQYRMVLDEEGNVGIGDTDPTVGSFARGLEISADGAGAALALTANAGRKFIIGSADTPAGLYFRDDTAGAYRMVIDANGKIGINTGVTNVLGTLDLRGNTAHQPIASLSGSTSFAGLIVDNTTGDLFSASSSGLNRFVIKNNGNVGIGTTNPNATLHITANGSVQNAGIEVNLNSWQPIISTNSADARLVLNNQYPNQDVTLMGNFSNDLLIGDFHNGAFNGIKRSGYDNLFGTFYDNWANPDAKPTSGSYINARSNEFMDFMVGGTTPQMRFDGWGLRINANGSVGYANANLEVLGITTGGINQGFVASISGKTGKATLAVDNLSSIGDLFTASASGLTRFVIQNNGNVGIGTSIPTDKLTVLSTAENAATFQRTGSTDTTMTIGGNVAGLTGEQYLTYRNANTTTNAWMAGMDDDSEFKIDYTTAGEIRNSSALFTFEQSGEFGIGTNDPSQEIHLLGTTDATTAVRIEATNTGASTYAEVNLATSTRQYNYGVGGPGVTSALKNSFFIYDNSAPNTRFLISPIGTVGIGGGTANVPIATLDLRGVVATFPVASISGSTNAGFAGLVVTNSGAGDIFTASSSGLERFTIKQNGQIQLDRTEYSACTNLQTVNGLLTCGSSGNSAVYGINNAAGSGTTTSSSYADMAATSSLSFTKASGTSKLLITVSTGAFSTVTGTEVQIGVRIDSTDYDCGYFFFNTASQHDAFTCSVVISGSSAGSKTVQMRWKRTAGTGTVTQNNDDWNSLTVTEAEAGDSLALWDAANGTVHLKNTTQDLLIGGTTSSSAHFRVAGNPGDALIPTVDIVKTSNALTAGASNLALRLDKNSDTTGEGIGIGFTASTDNTNVGAKIVHIRTGSQSQGDLAFYTKGDNASSSDTTRQVLRLSSTGTSPIATFSGTTSFAGMIVDNSGRGDLFTASSSGMPRFVIRQNGNVSIGNGQEFTTSLYGLTIQTPDSGLRVRTNLADGTLASFGGEGDFGIDAPNVANGRFVVKDNGLVGINSTSPLASLDVRGNFANNSLAGTQPVASISSRTSFAALVVDNPGSGDLFTASASGLTRFVIQNNGNVGIGTTIPNTKLHIDSGSDATLTGGGYLVLGSITSTNLILDNNELSARNNGALSNVFLQPDGGDVIISSNEFSSRLGLNTTSTVRGTLDVRVNLLNGATVPIATFSGSTNFAGLLVDNSGAGDLFTASSSGLSRFVIKQSGNVGIGTTTPTGILEVSNAAVGTTQHIGLVIDNDDVTDPFSLGMDTNDAGRKFIVSAQGGSLRQALAFGDVSSSTGTVFGISTSSDSGNNWDPRFAIQQGGNVGIGTIAPTALLDVAGSASVSGSLSFRSGAGSIQTTAFNTLTIGGDSTGNIIFNPRNGTAGGFIAPATDNVTDLGSSPSARFRSLYLGPGSLHVQCRTTDGCVQNTDYAFGINTTSGDLEIGVNGNTNDNNTKLRIAQSGEITLAGNVTVTGSLTAAGGALSNWNTANGTLYPKITSQDLLLGGTSSSSALFRVTGNSPFAGTTSVASVAANTSFAGLVVDNRGTGDLFTASSSGLSRFTIKNNGTLQLDTTNYNTCTSLTTVNGLVTCSTSGTGVSTTYGTRGVAAGGTVSTTSSSYSDMSTNDSVSFTKESSTSKLLVIVNTTAFNDIATGTYLGLGVNIDSTDYDCTSFNFSNVLVHTSISCSIVISDVSAGAKTVQMRWKRVSGTGTLYQDPGDFNSITVTELESGTDSSLFELASGAIVQKNITTDLLIGGVSSSSARFHVYGSANLAGTTPVASISANSSFAGLVVDNRGSGDLFTASSSGLNRFVIKQNGNVGIGTTLPEELLHIRRNSDTFLKIHASLGLGQQAGIKLQRGTTSDNYSDWNIYNDTGSLYFDVTESTIGTVNRLYINDQSGHIGINTTSPLATLDVRRTVGTQPTASFSGRTSFAGLVVDNSGAGDLFTASSSGLSRFVIKQNGNIEVGNTASTGDQGITISSQLNASIFLNADTDNVGGETGTAFIEFSQDNSTNHRYIGTIQATDQDPEGGTFTGAISNALLIGNTGSDVLQFGTNANVYMTMATDGNVGIGTTSTTGYGFQTHQSDSTGLIARLYNTANSNDADVLALQVGYTGTPGDSNNFVGFYDGDDALIGQIEGNGAGGVQYTETSDQRLKENIRDTHYSLDDLMQIKVRDYNFITAGVNTTGFIAQELYTIFPEAVSVGSDDLSEPWGVDYGKLTPLIIKGVQDQQGQLDELKQQVDTMIAGSLDTDDLTINNLTTQNFSLAGENINTKLAGLDQSASSSATLGTQLAQLQTDVLSLSDRLASAEARIDFLETLSGFSASSSAELSLDSLEVNGNILTDSLNVLGYTTMNELSVTGSIRTGVLTINGQTSGGASISTLNGDLKLQDQGFGGLDILDGLVTVDTDGNIETQGTITAKKINIDTTDTLSTSAGTGTVLSGTKSTIIYTTAVTEDSLIQITFTNDYAPATRYWIKTKVEGDSFTIELNQPVTTNSKFTWFIIN